MNSQLWHQPPVSKSFRELKNFTSLGCTQWAARSCSKENKEFGAAPKKEAQASVRGHGSRFPSSVGAGAELFCNTKS